MFLFFTLSTTTWNCQHSSKNWPRENGFRTNKCKMCLIHVVSQSIEAFCQRRLFHHVYYYRQLHSFLVWETETGKKFDTNIWYILTRFSMRDCSKYHGIFYQCVLHSLLLLFLTRINLYKMLLLYYVSSYKFDSSDWRVDGTTSL